MREDETTMATTKWAELRTQKEWKKELQDLLCRSDKAVVEAMLRIWDFQTSGEKIASQTLEENGVGFDKVDSSYMKQYVDKYYAGKLTKDDIAFLRSRMLRYWKQLMQLSKEKIRKQKVQEKCASGNITDM